jgi:uncharacterized membrane protein YdbT with pleckstrin-like domain
MNVTQTIRYEGPSYQEASVLQRMLEDQGVHVERPAGGRAQGDTLVERHQQERRELIQQQQEELAELQAEQEKERRELIERQQKERAEQPGALPGVGDTGQVVISLTSTGAAPDIAAAVTRFREWAPYSQVEVTG